MASLGLNVVSFFNSPMPAQPLGWFKEQITDASQMSGLKYRTVGLAADVLLEMGMSVLQLPGGEIQPAMKSALIDAAEFNNPTSDRDFGMQDVSKIYILASLCGIGAPTLSRTACLICSMNTSVSNCSDLASRSALLGSRVPRDSCRLFLPSATEVRGIGTRACITCRPVRL